MLAISRRWLTAGVLLSGWLNLWSAGPADEISKLEKSWVAAVVARDQAALDRMLGDQLIYAHSTGIIDSKTDYLTKLKTGAQNYTGIEHQTMTVKPYGDAAVVHAKVRMTGKNKDGPFDNQLMMMHVWAKQGGRWQLVAHQTTRLQ